MGELVWNGSDFVDSDSMNASPGPSLEGYKDVVDILKPYDSKYGWDPFAVDSATVNPGSVVPTPGLGGVNWEKYNKDVEAERANPTYRMTGGEAGSTVYYDNLGRRIEVNKDWNEKYGGGAGGFGWGDTKNFLDTVKITDKNGKPVSLAEIDKQQGVKNFVEALYDFRQSRQRPGPKGGGLRNFGRAFEGGWGRVLDFVNPISNLTRAVEAAREGDWWKAIDRAIDAPGAPVDAVSRGLGNIAPEGLRAAAPGLGKTIGGVIGTYVPVIGTALGTAIGGAVGGKIQQGSDRSSDNDYRAGFRDFGKTYGQGLVASGISSGINDVVPWVVPEGTSQLVQGGIKAGAKAVAHGGTEYAITGDKNQALQAAGRSIINSAIGDVQRELPRIDTGSRWGDILTRSAVEGGMQYGKGKLYESLGLTPNQEQHQVASTWRPRTPEEVEAEADKEVGRKPVTAEDFPGGQFVWHPGTPPQFTTIQTSPQQFTGGEMPAMPTFNVSGGSKDVVVDPRRIDLSETAASRVAQDIKESPQRTLSSLYGVQSVGIGGRGRIGRQAPRVRGGTRLGDARTIT